MKGLWLERGQISLRSDLAEPRPEPGEALVEVVLAGVCGTDLALLEGYAGFAGIPGHEFVGRIAECAGEPRLVGRRVVGEINVACRQCAECRAGHSNHCRRRRVLGIRDRGGSFAEFLVLPLSNLHEVTDSISDRAAVFTEPLAAALRIGEQIGGLESRRVLIVGAGRLGQLVARALAASGCKPRILVKYPRQAELLEAFAEVSFAASELQARSFDLVIEVTGCPSGFQVALEAVRPRGTIVLKSTYRELTETDLSRVVVDEIRLVGSRCGPFPQALTLLERGLDVEPLIEAVLPLDDALGALEAARRPGAMKILLQISSSRKNHPM